MKYSPQEHDALADAARAALKDRNDRASKNSDDPGSRAWIKREPVLAEAVLVLLDEPVRGDSTSVRAMHEGEVRLLQEEISRLNGELRDLRFEHDRYLLAYVASYELASKIAAECADPERIEPHIRRALKALNPESEVD